MTKEQGGGDAAPSALSRRKLLAGAGLASAAATGVVLGKHPHEHPLVTPAAAQQAPARAARVEAFETLNIAEAETLEAITARLIPTDETGPGAREARAAHYIDRALAGAYAGSRNAYQFGLAAVEAYAREKHKNEFVKLTAAQQDAVLSDMEKNVATGFSPNAASFFNLVRTHTIEGTFCDPYYGGNADYVGWDLLGYPGIKVTVTESDQRMNPKPKIDHRSAYDEEMFTKGTSHGNHP